MSSVFVRLLFVLVVFVVVSSGVYFILRSPKAPPSVDRIEREPPSKPLGMIAVIIDDNGYTPDSCRPIRAIRHPIAISILPHLPYSRFVADCAHAAHKEIMLHMPMEPHVWYETYQDDYVLTTDMPPDKIRQLLNSAIQSVPYAQGVNNHMGSKATEDKALMTIFLQELRKRNLFFIDSRVTLDSAAPHLAEQLDLPYAERNVFLDNEADRAYIAGQFEELAQKAHRDGRAIGIGHARPLTWAVMKEQLISLEERGFRIVTISELLTDPGQQ